MSPDEIAHQIINPWVGIIASKKAIAAAIAAERERYDALLTYAAELEARAEKAEATRERMWCLACGTVSRNDECDCTKFAETADKRRAVNYADALKDECDKERAAREKAEYELKRWKEVAANKPDWEKLWEEQVIAREKAEAEAREFQHIFDLHHAARNRAIKRWQEAHPGNDLVWPDPADLMVWLMERAEKAEAERDEWKLRAGNAEPWRLYDRERQRAEKAEAERDDAREAYQKRRLAHLAARDAALREAAADLDKHGHDFAAIRVRALIDKQPQEGK